MKKVYNIYYEGDKLNKLPMSEDELNKVYSKQFIYKEINNKRQKIELKDTIIRECIVI